MNSNKTLSNNSDRKQTDLQDEKGRFKKGNTPPAGFNANPQNRHNGANINGMAFNVDYIAQMSPDMANSIMSLYEAVRSLEREYKEEVA